MSNYSESIAAVTEPNTEVIHRRISQEVQRQVSEAFHDLREEFLSEVRKMHVQFSKISLTPSAVSKNTEPDYDHMKEEIAQGRGAKDLALQIRSQMQAQIDAVTNMVNLSHSQFQIAMCEASLVALTSESLTQQERRIAIQALSQQKATLLESVAKLQQSAPDAIDGLLNFDTKTPKKVLSIGNITGTLSHLPPASSLPPRWDRARVAKDIVFVVEAAGPLGLEFSTSIAPDGSSVWTLEKVKPGSAATGKVETGDQLVGVNRVVVSNCAVAQIDNMLQMRPVQLQFQSFPQKAKLGDSKESEELVEV